jgi:hypothetical protein
MSDPATYHLDPDRVYNSLVKAGEEWADKQSAADLLEETKKSVLAELTNQCEGKSHAVKESTALALPEYRLHLANMVKARRDANICRVRYEAQKMLAELRRTEASTRRAEMTLR